METLNAGEIYETRDVAETNELLALGWKLLSIERDWRSHIYVLGTRTIAESAGPETPALATSNNLSHGG